MKDRLEYFVMNMEQFSGSVILVLALLIGMSLGWFLRGLRSRQDGQVLNYSS